MPAYIIVLLAVSITAATIFTIISFKKTLLNLFLKIASSMFFVILGLFCLFSLVSKSNGEYKDNVLIGEFLLVLGQILSLIGDMILGMPRISELKRDRIPVIVGGASWFFLAHLIYCVALAVLFGITLWVLAFILPMALFFTYGNKFFGKLDYKGLTVGIFIYSLIESLSFALCILSLLTNYSLSALILTIGFAFFYASDMVLMHNYFGEKRRYISVLCHSFYYPAQILIAISIFFLI